MACILVKQTHFDNLSPLANAYFVLTIILKYPFASGNAIAPLSNHIPLEMIYGYELGSQNNHTLVNMINNEGVSENSTKSR